MNPHPPYAANILRIRTSLGLTQQQVADEAGISRVAYRDIETGQTSSPRVGNLQSIAAALGVGLQELLVEPPTLATARFRSAKVVGQKDRARRDRVVADVARWIRDFGELEKLVGEGTPWKLHAVAQEVQNLPAKDRPLQAAKLAREALKLGDEPVRDICGLLESAGVKVLPLDIDLEALFGLSVAQADGGPAVVVNTADGISVERQIFSAAHELGHLLLHPGAYDVVKVAEDDAEEKQADSFAAHFLMPTAAFDKEWKETYGLPFVERVLHIKRLFRVSYKTVLYRLIEMKVVSNQVWQRFNFEYKRRYNKSLGRRDEPFPLATVDFVEDRLCRMVRKAVESQTISLSRAAEILRVDLKEMRERVASWNIAA